MGDLKEEVGLDWTYSPKKDGIKRKALEWNLLRGAVYKKIKGW